MKPLNWLNNLTQVRFDLENDDTRAEHITRVIILLISGIVLLFTPIVLLVILSDPAPFDWFGLIILVCLLLLIIIGWFLIKIGRWKLARNIPVVLFISLGFLGVSAYNFGTTFLLFFALAVVLAGIFYPQRTQSFILLFIIVGTFSISCWIEKDWELTISAIIPFSGLLFGVWLLQLLNHNLLQKSLQHQIELTAKFRREVDERLRTEQKLAEANLDLEKRVQERTAQLQSVGYSIAHDLRAPIRAIIGLNEMIISEHSRQIDQEILDYLDKTIEASNRMDSMLESLLSLLNLGNTDLAPRRLDLSAIAQEIFTNLTENLPASEISFTAHPTPSVFADQELIIELIAQLITNAINFSKPGSHLEIEFGAGGTPDQPVFYLKDNGIGINMEYAHRVFDPFIRLSPTDQHTGNGIGLTIAQRIVELHRGKIWVESEVDQGSTFHFTL